MATWEKPSLEVERSSSMPSMVLTAPSILSLMSVSTSSGAAPSSVVVTSTNGRSMFGELVEAEPRVTHAAEHHDDQHQHAREDRAPHTDLSEPLHCLGSSPRYSALCTAACERDLLAVAEHVRIRNHDLLAVFDAARDRDAITDVGPERDDALLQPPVRRPRRRATRRRACTSAALGTLGSRSLPTRARRRRTCRAGGALGVVHHAPPRTRSRVVARTTPETKRTLPVKRRSG